MAINWLIIEDKPDRIKAIKDAIFSLHGDSNCQIYWMTAPDFSTAQQDGIIKSDEFRKVVLCGDIILLDLKWRESGLSIDFDWNTDCTLLRNWAVSNSRSLVYVYSSGDNAAAKVKELLLEKNVIGTNLTQEVEIVQDALSSYWNLQGIDFSPIDQFFIVNDGHDGAEYSWTSLPLHLMSVAKLLGITPPSPWGEMERFWQGYFGTRSFPTKCNDGSPGAFNPVYEGIKQIRENRPSVSITSAILFLWAGMRRRIDRDKNGSFDDIDAQFTGLLSSIRTSEFALHESGRHSHIAGPFAQIEDCKRVCRSLYHVAHDLVLSKSHDKVQFINISVSASSVEFEFDLQSAKIQGQFPLVVDPLVNVLGGRSEKDAIPHDGKKTIRAIVALNSLLGINSGSANTGIHFSHYFRWSDQGRFVFGLTKMPHLRKEFNTPKS